MAIQFLTDSTSDILPDEAARRGISVVPLRVAFGDEVFRDNVDIDHATFFERLMGAQELPTTSQPTPEDFLVEFEAVKASGDTLVCIMLSSSLSGTVQSALIAKDICEYDNIHIVDSMQSVTGLRLLVDLACVLREQGASVAEIIREVEDARGRIQILAVVDTLTYLHKGGRLSSAVTMVGTLMKVKPLVTLEDGVLSLKGKGIGAKDAMGKIIKQIDNIADADSRLPIYFGYTYDRGQCELLKSMVEEHCACPRSEMHSVGSVIGTHVGPKAAVVCYLVKKA